MLTGTLARPWRLVLTVLAVLGLVVAAKAWRDTMADPQVHRAQIALARIAPGSAPVTAALLADIHVAGPDMPPSRLERIVEQVNALEPDIVLIAGDLVSEKASATHVYTPSEIAAPLGGLRAPLGVVVVPGNHDHWFGWPALAAQLRRQNVRILENQAVALGPLAIGGVDDDYTGRADVPATLAGMSGLAGGRLILTHSPDIFPQVPREVSLVLAGHTHCGQWRYPWGGAPATLSRYGDLYACGMIEEGERTLITSGGLGTSLLPWRFNTRPEIWLIELGPQ